MLYLLALVAIIKASQIIIDGSEYESEDHHMMRMFCIQRNPI